MHSLLLYALFQCINWSSRFSAVWGHPLKHTFWDSDIIHYSAYTHTMQWFMFSVRPYTKTVFQSSCSDIDFNIVYTLLDTVRPFYISYRLWPWDSRTSHILNFLHGSIIPFNVLMILTLFMEQEYSVFCLYNKYPSKNYVWNKT